MSQDSQPKLGLNPNAKAFVPKPKGAPTGPTVGAVPNPTFPPQGTSPEYPYQYPGMPYYSPYQPQDAYDDYYGEDEEKDQEHDNKDHKKPKKEKKKKTEVKKAPAKKEVKEKKKEAPKVPKPPKEEEKKKLPEPDNDHKDEDEEEPRGEYVAVDEKRQPLSIVFIGHVDVGKSTICGQIMIITEKVDARTIKKYEQEAKEKNRDTWWLAYVMDLNEEERLKGKTVEVGRATFVTEHKRYTIYDAPGHLNYVPNMIMGAAMADIGALVISAKKGEFESGYDRGGQTLEHMLLAKSLGIQKLIMVVNKMDEPSVKWSKERYEEIKTALTPYLSRYGFNPEKNVSWVPISGLKGINIVEKIDKKICSWYTGPTLMEILETIEMPERDDKAPLRIPILDKMKSRGTDIFGKVNTGRIDVGMQIVVMPFKLPAEIVSISNTDDNLVKYAKAGENVKLVLKGLPSDDYIYKGCLLCAPTDLCAVFQTFMAEVKIVNILPHKPIISTGYQCVLHLHTIAEECTIAKLLGIKSPKDKDYREAKFAKDEDQIKCVITTKMMIAAEKYSVNRQLGRFTLRDEGKTIAIGTIQKYMPMKEGGKS